MKTENFEHKLKQMTKPQINDLRHQDLLAEEITRAKDRSVLSWWWISVPVYIVAVLLMKTLFMPDTLITNLHELEKGQKFTALILFLIVPLLLIVLNSMTIRRIYFLSGSPKSIIFLKAVWYNVLVIIAALLIILLYLL